MKGLDNLKNEGGELSLLFHYDDLKHNISVLRDRYFEKIKEVQSENANYTSICESFVNELNELLTIENIKISIDKYFMQPQNSLLIPNVLKNEYFDLRLEPNPDKLALKYLLEDIESSLNKK
ncbi:hypothetical protein [uncultured Methanobrevibacter sp.]|uniref:hypothetical protein n=1 Tax=uncultured Methanobrevibacter sp. TaxID=253161 RepID=UPI0025F14180|nr:hypothetical protein [uncultured Methanobrevibacter sp.]